MNTDNNGLMFISGLACLFLIFIMTVLFRIDTKIGYELEIQSEIRDATWIIACDDISESDAPVTFEHCNE